MSRLGILHNVSHDTEHDASGVPAPPFVYVPVSLDADGQPADIRMIRLGDGRIALLGYTALDRFVRCCGPDQPWMVLATSALPELHAEKPFDVKLLDVELPADVRTMLAAAG